MYVFSLANAVYVGDAVFCSVFLNNISDLLIILYEIFNLTIFSTVKSIIANQDEDAEDSPTDRRMTLLPDDIQGI